MPAFTFEKISPPPAAHGSAAKGAAVKGSANAGAPAVEKKPRGMISQILGRFIDLRVERVLRVERRVINRRGKRSPEQS
jgi:hypothetical protein